jgi:hypothetical protein
MIAVQDRLPRVEVLLPSGSPTTLIAGQCFLQDNMHIDSYPCRRRQSRRLSDLHIRQRVPRTFLIVTSTAFARCKSFP